MPGRHVQRQTHEAENSYTCWGLLLILFSQ
jgi:hypothetical protein